MKNLATLQNKALITLRDFIDGVEGIPVETAKIALDSLVFSAKLDTSERAEEPIVPVTEDDFPSLQEYCDWLQGEVEACRWRAVLDSAAWVESELKQSPSDRETPSNLLAIRILLWNVLLHFPKRGDQVHDLEGDAVHRMAYSIYKALMPCWEKELEPKG